MSQALYRKYRPKTVADVVGQAHITDTLAHALKTGKLAHAYLFTGPRGVGKTSIARILAHEINGLPYTDDSMHMDIIEIDAASNRRIDEIRELRDKVNVAPSSAKYKVYIIDEVHMLTREAFNALLKTLEEPPAHVVFILATTESHKLPETIISRTQRFMFKPVDLDQVAAHLRSLAEAEGIKIDDEALKLIAAHGEGSFRDSISLLDQTRGHDGAVDGDYVRSLIGLPTDEAITDLQQAIIAHDAAQTVNTLSQLRDKGFGSAQVAKHLGRHLRQNLIQGNQPAGLHDVFGLLQKLLDVPAAHEPDTYLELVLLEYALAGQQPTLQATPPAAPEPSAPPAPAPVPKATAQPPSQPSTPPPATPPPGQPVVVKPATAEVPATAKQNTPASPPSAAAAAPAATPAPEQTAAATAAPSGPSRPLDATTWPQVLDRLKKTHNTLYGIARMARPEFQANGIILHFKFAFHQKRLSEVKNRDVIMAAIQAEIGQAATFKCQLEEKTGEQASAPAAESNAAPQPAPASNDPLAAISNIFGSAEVIEA